MSVSPAGERLPVDGADEQLADDIASNPDLYDLAANRDENKELELETPRD
jgi:hypothetical protein